LVSSSKCRGAAEQEFIQYRVRDSQRLTLNLLVTHQCQAEGNNGVIFVSRSFVATSVFFLLMWL